MTTFAGFDKKTLKFFRDLTKNNNKQWFAEHKGEYEQYVLAPAQEFVEAMAKKLPQISPGLQAIPKINKSIFRIYRDTRFSSDKTPYKTHVSLLFWEGPLKKTDCPGFYFHLEPTHLWVGGGMWMFNKQMLAAYRHAVVHPVHGSALAAAIAKLSHRGLDIGGQRKKRIPHGFDGEHPRADLLLYDGMFAGLESPIIPELFTPKIVDWAFRHFKKTIELHQWLTALVERTA